MSAIHSRTKIRIGTSSWADPEFVRDWYPKGLPASDRLSWYAEHFDYVEVNSSFYAIPAEPVVARWDVETPGNFLFDVKLHRLLSRHAAPPDALPKDLRTGLRLNSRGNVILTPELEETVAHRFLETVTPLREAGKLGALLLQLSPSFSPGKHRLDELEGLIEICKGHRLAVELRNRAWVTGDRLEETLAFFREAKLAMVLVDAPASEHATVMPALDLVTNPALSYLRLHGRNEEGYLHGKSVAQRFDYVYSDDELDDIGARIERLAEDAREVHIAFNNNRSNYAPKAAESLRRKLRREES